MKSKVIACALGLSLLGGASQAANLIVNGDFSAGDTGFSSDYSFDASNGTIFTNPGQYGITTNPATGFTNGYVSYGDHTSGTGNMLLFDGQTAGNIWQQSVALAANTTYTFSYYATTPDGGTPSGSDIGVLEATVNGAGIDSGVAITTQAGSPWQLVSDSFTTTSAGSYSLALKDLNNTGFNNDDTIDDISLVSNSVSAAPEPSTWALMLTGLGGVGLMLRRARKGLGAGSAAAA